ncbi:hypothetical protein KAI54_02185 [Candidatus Gracilibacteria bacterium]|nr:hypothetical protein [Candidatus Gracilibacteria bacterium]
MQKLLPTLLTILLLIGCAQSSVETDEVKEKNQTTDNFEKNLECQKFKEELEENKLEMFKSSIQGIFYSPKTNSCLYVLISAPPTDSTSNYLSYELIDFFTRQTIEQYTNHPNYTGEIKSIDDFQEKVKEYQN